MTTLPQLTKTYVLIHGSNHGGWCYNRVAAILRSQGHRVFAPTLAGLAERVSMDARRINLTTHIDEIIKLFEPEDLREVGAVRTFLWRHGHSGRCGPDRISNLVFLDAVVPEKGKSMNDYVFPGWRLLPIVISIWLFGRGHRLTPPPQPRFSRSTRRSGLC
ncbi:alpha/beta hydrolase (plasmid) [Nitrobacteraceae bacterium UC4446_H13]